MGWGTFSSVGGAVGIVGYFALVLRDRRDARPVGGACRTVSSVLPYPSTAGCNQRVCRGFLRHPRRGDPHLHPRPAGLQACPADRRSGPPRFQVSLRLWRIIKTESVIIWPIMQRFAGSVPWQGPKSANLGQSAQPVKLQPVPSFLNESRNRYLSSSCMRVFQKVSFKREPANVILNYLYWAECLLSNVSVL